MIKISSYLVGATATPKRSKRASSTSGSSFADAISDATDAGEQVSAANASQAPASIASLLSLQEISDDEVATKKAIKHANLTLDALEDLRMGLLTGEVSTHMLSEIDQLVAQQREQTSDPALQDILDDIELRAAVELAKREML